MRICTIARDGSRCARCPNGQTNFIYTGAIYEAKRRKDGVWTWRRWGNFGDTTTGSLARLKDKIIDDAPYPWINGVRHGDVVTVRSDLAI